MPTPLEILNERLASGDISLSEYDLIKSKITQETQSPKINDQHIEEKQEYVEIDKKNYLAPSNRSPISINSYLMVAGDYFIYKDIKYLFTQVTHKTIDISRDTLNFIPSTSVWFGVSCDNQKVFSVSSSGTIINRSKRTNMIVCGIYLGMKTQLYRFENSMELLKKNGFIDIDGVRFFCNGNVVKGSKTINILAKENDVSIKYGRYIGGSVYFTVNNPNLVKITENKQSGLFNKKISFEMSSNKDLTPRIINLIRNGKLLELN